ncbi:membrane dipeptidase [Aminipila butyrica]|uniref:Membrane dipeptidase n=1 Tax=Aminipila butyrica TaxID=433296 RepID=A0A858BW19_9FIRM|nr:dipeptidase [Aminipila butyrica]QIB68924.1 membrane dipeptidase [Aminipila butyrica]
MNIIDMHCDTILECYRDPAYTLASNPGHITIKKLIDGQALAQFFAIFISPKEKATMDPYDIFNQVYETYQFQLALNAQHLCPATCSADILVNAKANKISALLAIEDGVVLGDRLERIQDVFDKGVRLITLTWNFENAIGYPSSDDPAEHQRGLKPFGLEVVSEMNRLGMLIDVSHLSEGGFYDVARHSRKPFVASHSCARALCNHRRNLTDDQLRLLGQQGGLVGVNFCSAFLEADSEYATIQQIVNHVKHMVDKAGIESVGLGSDFDGIECGLEFGDYAGYPSLLEALSGHFTDDQVEKIAKDNAFRILRETIG